MRLLLVLNTDKKELKNNTYDTVQSLFDAINVWLSSALTKV